MELHLKSRITDLEKTETKQEVRTHTCLIHEVKLEIERGLLMMGLLFATRVILGKTEFNAVPAKLKAQVADILINECGLPELVPTEYGGTAEGE